jgi:hypothetical protein
MVALVRRHPKLHLDTSAHRAKYLGQAGSGWEMLMQFGNTLIQDKVLVGLSAGLVDQTHETLIQECLELPLKDAVKEKWLYGNAARVFGVEQARRPEWDLLFMGRSLADGASKQA